MSQSPYPDWPEVLLQELALARVVIFVGAGLSASVTSPKSGERPPGWGALLTACVDEVDAQDTHAAPGNAHSDGHSAGITSQWVRGAIERGEFLRAADGLHALLNGHPSALERAFHKVFVEPEFAPGKAHRALRDLQARTLITTNYDCLLEDTFRGDTQSGLPSMKSHDFRHREAISSCLRRGGRQVIHAHGSLKSPASIVLSREEYFNAKREHGDFYQLLSALFLTHTVLFVGCSMSDPDIGLLLEDVAIHVPTSAPHYALMCESETNPVDTNFLRKAHNVQLLTYSDYPHFTGALEDLAARVKALREMT